MRRSVVFGGNEEGVCQGRQRKGMQFGEAGAFASRDIGYLAGEGRLSSRRVKGRRCGAGRHESRFKLE